MSGLSLLGCSPTWQSAMMERETTMDHYRELIYLSDEKVEAGQAEGARELLTEGLKRAEERGESAAAVILQAELAFLDGDYPRALEHGRLALAMMPDSSLLQFCVAVYLASAGRADEALPLYDQALAERPTDAKILKNRGMALFLLGQPQEALNHFERALEYDPDDEHLLVNRAVCLGNMGYLDEGMRCLQLALEAHPDSWRLLREMGAMLIANDNPSEAVAPLEKALALKPDDARGHFFRGKCAEVQGEPALALDHYRRTLELACSPADDYLRPVVEFKLAHLCTPIPGPEQEPAAAEGSPAGKHQDTEVFPPPDDKSKGTDVLNRILNKLDPGRSGGFLKGIEEARKKLDEFTSDKPSIPREFSSFFSVLRKWNSYTPVLPSKHGDNQGGGYFLFHKGKGIVIDPGFNFVENFYGEGFKVADIDAVLITHAHNDHTVDLESILSLLYKLNKDRRESEGASGTCEDKKIDLLINAGTFMKYSGWLSLRSEDNGNFVGNVTVMHPDITYQYGGLKLHATKARHHEIVSSRYCIGCVIEEDAPDGFRIGLTGDTGWEHDGSIAAQFASYQPDLVVAHLGSIREKEFQYDKATTEEERRECYYSSHLGILGITNFLHAVKPKLTVISEFGEELRDVRRPIAEALGEVLGILCLPGDIGLHIRLPDLGVLCFVERDFVPADAIVVRPIERGNESSLVYCAKSCVGPRLEDAEAARNRWCKRPMDQKLVKM